MSPIQGSGNTVEEGMQGKTIGAGRWEKGYKVLSPGHGTIIANRNSELLWFSALGLHKTGPVMEWWRDSLGPYSSLLNQLATDKFGVGKSLSSVVYPLVILLGPTE